MEKVEIEQEQECIFTKFEVGGVCCLNCEHFFGIDYEERWIKCTPYSAIQENELLTNKVEQLENELINLKGGL